MKSAEFVIIGAGLAGAATAWHLARRGATDIAILEQENSAGVHSSGRNASMIRQVVADPAIGALARAGAEFIRSIPGDWSERPRFDPNGSLLTSSGEAAASLRRDMELARARGVEAEWLDHDQCVNKVEALADADFEGGVWCPTDGVVDVAALLSGYLREAQRLGARLYLRHQATRLEAYDNRIFAVETTGGTIHCKTVINAAGPWAGAVAALAGAPPLPLAPCRRHIYISGPQPWIRTDWPFVWDMTHEFYFRPEPPGLLLCPCDAAEQPPGIPEEDPAIVESLAMKMIAGFPRLADLDIFRSWAGLRTLAPDGRFIIGWDSKIRNFLWVAGLGGHGVTTSAAVGGLAANLLTGETSESAPAFDPARFNA